jgi:hypothetical protein
LAELVKNAAQQYANTVGSCPKHAEGKRRHIALLFLTIDDLPHEHIWREWIKGSPADTGTDDADGSSQSNLMVSILCHAKYPERITSPWLKQRHLIRFRNEKEETKESQPPKLHSRRPEWGSIEITRGMIDLLEEGLRIGSLRHDGGENDVKPTDGKSSESAKPFSYARYLSTPGDALEDTVNESCIPSNNDIPPVDRFIFVSESCLPVTTLKEVEMALFGPKPTESNENNPKKNPYDKSWINARSTPNNGYSRQLQWDEIRPTDIPPTLIWKADQWIILNRSHGRAVASLPDKYLNGRSLWYAFRRCRASDEMYFPTALSILGVIVRSKGVTEVEDGNELCAGSEIRRRKVTYCDWSTSAKNPASFTVKDLEGVAKKARGEGCLFARKFVVLTRREGEGDGIVSVEDWLSLMRKMTVK